MPRLLIAAALILAACVPGSAQSPSAPSRRVPHRHSRHRGLQRHMEIFLRHDDTAGNKSAKDEKILRNDCWRSAGYYACNQFLDGKSQDLIVFTYQPDQNLYTTYIVPLDGTKASSGTLEIHGNTWTYPWEVADKGATVYHRVVNIFNSPTSIQFRSEFSTDKINWTTTMTGSEARVSD